MAMRSLVNSSNLASRTSLLYSADLLKSQPTPPPSRLSPSSRFAPPLLVGPPYALGLPPSDPPTPHSSTMPLGALPPVPNHFLEPLAASLGGPLSPFPPSLSSPLPPFCSPYRASTRALDRLISASTTSSFTPASSFPLSTSSIFLFSFCVSSTSMAKCKR